MHFEKIQIERNGIGAPAIDLVLTPRQNFLVGDPGSGMGFLIEAMASSAAAQNLVRSPAGNCGFFELQCFFKGDMQDLARFKPLIFIDFETSNKAIDDWLAANCSEKQRSSLQQNAREILLSMIRYKPRRHETYRNIDSALMAAGECFCFKLATIFATRKILSVDLPAVFDRPYNFLDAELTVGLREFLDGYHCQQIFLLSQAEYQTVYLGRSALFLDHLCSRFQSCSQS